MQRNHIVVRYRELSQMQARQWLIANDPEHAAGWLKAGLTNDVDLVSAVGDNLWHFGIKDQCGSIVVTHPGFDS